jgi:hypothetical protein
MMSLIQNFQPYAFTLPQPHPVQPPGTDAILTVLNWMSYGCLILALGGFLAAAGSLAVAHHTGRPVDSFKGLAYAVGSAILVGAAGLIMQMFVP